MAFLVQHVYDIIRHALRGEPSKELSLASIVNDAGERLINMHGWNFCARAPTTLDLVSGQSFVTLPSDFSRHIAINFTTDTTSHVVTATMAKIQAIRVQQNPGTHALYYCYGWATDTNGVPVLRLEVAPTPQADADGALTLWYRAGWNERRQETQGVPIPPYVRPLYTEIVRAVAIGYHEDDQATVADRVNAIRSSSVFADAVARDRETQADAGVPGPSPSTAEWFASIDWSSATVLPPS